MVTCRRDSVHVEASSGGTQEVAGLQEQGCAVVRMEGHRFPVVFDLDGVLIMRDSLTALLLRALRARPLRIVRVLPPALTVAIRGRRLEERTRAVSRLVAILFDGVTTDEMDRMCRHVGRRAATSRRWTRPSLVNEYRALQDDGHPVMVATATERRIALTLLEFLGLRAEELISSEIAVTGAQATLERYAYGPEKARLLSGAGPSLIDARFYTDSRSDLPAARLMRTAVLVEPSRATRRAFVQAAVAHTEWPQT